MGGRNVVVGAGRRPKVQSNDGTDFDDVTDIAPPDYLLEMDHAVAMWKIVTPEILKKKILKITDIHNIEMFCIAYHNMRKAQQEVALNGVTVVTAMGRSKNPALTVVNEASKQMASFGAMLGLDPASRARLTGVKGKPKSNPFAGVLNM